MTNLNSFRDRQAELLEMISDIKAMLKPEVLSIKPNAKLAYQTICALADKMKVHLAAGSEDVYPPLLTHEDSNLKSLAWGFLSGEKPIRKSYEDYYKKWLKNCDFNFSEEFRADTVEVLDMLADRIQREQDVLLPKLEKSGVFQHSQA